MADKDRAFDPAPPFTIQNAFIQLPAGAVLWQFVPLWQIVPYCCTFDVEKLAAGKLV
jgi:hypothetical protein